MNFFKRIRCLFLTHNLWIMQPLGIVSCDRCGKQWHYAPYPEEGARL